MVPDRFVKKKLGKIDGESENINIKTHRRNLEIRDTNSQSDWDFEAAETSKGYWTTLFSHTKQETQSTRIAEFKPPHHRKQHTISFRNFFNSKKCKENAQKPTYNHAINYRRDNFLIRMASPGSVYAQCELHVFQVNTSQASATRLATLSVDSKQLTVTQPPTHAASRPLIGHQVFEVPPFSQLAPPIAVSTNQRVEKEPKQVILLYGRSSEWIQSYGEWKYEPRVQIDTGKEVRRKWKAAVLCLEGCHW